LDPFLTDSSTADNTQIILGSLLVDEQAIFYAPHTNFRAQTPELCRPELYNIIPSKATEIPYTTYG
jgi:hypothetical protein